MALDNTDKKILNELQFDFPLAEKPYAEIGQKTGLTEDEVIRRVEKLKQDNVIRRIGPTFEGTKLGYVNTLVALKVTPEGLDNVGNYISSFAEVTHNYSREGDYNLWFTLTCANLARMEAILSEIKNIPDCQELHSLPALKKFKINARFEL